MERKNSSYELQDYYDLLKNSFNPPIEVDLVRNKLDQGSVRIRYAISRLKAFDMFIFENGFAVSYKPNGRTKLYEYITPKQARAIAKQVLRYMI